MFFKRNRSVLVVLLIIIMVISSITTANALYDDSVMKKSFVFDDNNESFVFHDATCNDSFDHENNTRATFPTCGKSGCTTNSLSGWTLISTTSAPIAPYNTPCDGTCNNPDRTPNHRHYITSGTTTVKVYRCNLCSSTYTQTTKQMHIECRLP